jgi:hypothetical protein
MAASWGAEDSPEEKQRKQEALRGGGVPSPGGCLLMLAVLAAVFLAL